MSISNPIVIGILFAVGIAIVSFMALPGKQRLVTFSGGSGLNLKEKLRTALRDAGIFEQSPSIVAMMCSGAAAIISAAAVFYFGPLYYLAAGPVVVAIAFQLYLSGKQRRFMNAAYEELVPFLNRISTAVTAGLPPQRAYLQAVEDSVALRPILSDSAAKMASGGEFVPCLLETIPLFQLRMWATFVRQMELHEQVGGDVARALQTTTNQLTKIQRLQAETRADFSMQEKQQRLIMLIVGFGIFSMFFVLPGGSERLTMTFSSSTGILMSIFGLITMAGGVMYLRKQLKDVEKKLSA